MEFSMDKSYKKLIKEAFLYYGKKFKKEMKPIEQMFLDNSINFGQNTFLSSCEKRQIFRWIFD